MRIRVYGSAQALYCVANTLYWKSFKRQIFTHLTVLKHQNTKTSLYELSKNHWVFALFEILGPSAKNYNPQSLMITLYCASVVRANVLQHMEHMEQKDFGVCIFGHLGVKGTFLFLNFVFDTCSNDSITGSTA